MIPRTGVDFLDLDDLAMAMREGGRGHEAAEAAALKDPIRLQSDRSHSAPVRL
jgi:hypothetical protein